MNKASEHREGLRAYKAVVFGLLNLVAIIMLWNEPNYRWFNIISLLAWVFYIMLAFFVAGEAQYERMLNDLNDYNLYQERIKNANKEESDNEENNSEEN